MMYVKCTYLQAVFVKHDRWHLSVIFIGKSCHGQYSRKSLRVDHILVISSFCFLGTIFMFVNALIFKGDIIVCGIILHHFILIT